MVKWWKNSNSPVYYPGTTDMSGAARIDLSAGASVDGMDITITMGAVRARRIRGVVLVNGQPVPAAGITAIPRTPDPSPLIPSGRTNADGSFDVSGLLPGSYFVFARTNPGLTGGLALEVGDADIDNLVIPVTPGAASDRPVHHRRPLSHRRRSRHGQPARDRAADPDLLGMPQAGPTFSPPPGVDGEFELQGVPPGDFRVSVRALPPDAYVKSMHMGSVDVLESGLHLSGSQRTRWRLSSGQTPEH